MVRYWQQKHWLKGNSRKVELSSHRVGGLDRNRLKRKNKIKAASEISWLQSLVWAKAPKTLDLTLPIMQLNNVILLDPKPKLPNHKTTVFITLKGKVQHLEKYASVFSLFMKVRWEDCIYDNNLSLWLGQSIILPVKVTLTERFDILKVCWFTF